jgi:hypothetical protein
MYANLDNTEGIATARNILVATFGGLLQRVHFILKNLFHGITLEGKFHCWIEAINYLKTKNQAGIPGNTT